MTPQGWGVGAAREVSDAGNKAGNISHLAVMSERPNNWITYITHYYLAPHFGLRMYHYPPPPTSLLRCRVTIILRATIDRARVALFAAVRLHAVNS